MVVVIELEIPEKADGLLTVSGKIHNILNGNPDYINSSIVLGSTPTPKGSPVVSVDVGMCDKFELSAALGAIVDMVIEES